MFPTLPHQRLWLEFAWICALYKFCNNNNNNNNNNIIIIGCTNVTDRRQTDGRRHNSERAHEFTFANNTSHLLTSYSPVKKIHNVFGTWFFRDIAYALNLADVPAFLLCRLSRALLVVQTSPVNNVRVSITLFLTYLPWPVPSDVRLFIQAAYTVTHDWRLCIVGPTWQGTGQLSWAGMDRKECYRLTHPCRKFLATPLSPTVLPDIAQSWSIRLLLLTREP